MDPHHGLIHLFGVSCWTTTLRNRRILWGNTQIQSSCLLSREITNSIFDVRFLNSKYAPKWRDMPDYDFTLWREAKPVEGLLSVHLLYCALNPSLPFFIMVWASNPLAEWVHAGCLYIWPAESKVQRVIHMCCLACKASEKRWREEDWRKKHRTFSLQVKQTNIWTYILG